MLAKGAGQLAIPVMHLNHWLPVCCSSYLLLHLSAHSLPLPYMDFSLTHLLLYSHYFTYQREHMSRLLLLLLERCAQLSREGGEDSSWLCSKAAGDGPGHAPTVLCPLPASCRPPPPGLSTQPLCTDSSRGIPNHSSSLVNCSTSLMIFLCIYSSIHPFIHACNHACIP